MTPKEKAIDLVDTYKFVLWSEDTQCGDEILCTGIAKRCALISVDEIIEALSFHSWQNSNEIEYYEEVKHEIQKL
jgi:hypothetical protein